MRRVAILISGGGSNMQALIRDMTGNHPCRSVLVVADTPSAKGLGIASGLGVPVAVVDRSVHADRAAFEAALSTRIRAATPDLICLAGFMRVLSGAFVAEFRGQILNIHPSLLPAYRGLHTHARALAAGDARAGCSVHEVTQMLDAGRVLGRARVDVHVDDTAQTLAARVLTAEHRLYPAVLRRVAMGNRELLEI